MGGKQSPSGESQGGEMKGETNPRRPLFLPCFLLCFSALRFTVISARAVGARLHTWKKRNKETRKKREEREEKETHGRNGFFSSLFLLAFSLQTCGPVCSPNFAYELRPSSSNLKRTTVSGDGRLSS